MKYRSKVQRTYRHALHLLPAIITVMISFVLIIVSCVTTGHATPAYPVQVVSENEVFIINGHRYEAMTACEGITEGDWIIFLQGSPYGTCSSAVIQNLHTGATCKLWCD
ncbi:MAG: hypothetical protein PHU49_08210 [Syntrophorhabdaceae bacterium]|nr:hypothetical protein [Syntrophorhabdaceae bacterium]MDD5243986.1 hypothetical protein [Syntrophorhabdaceae bacterium]